MTIRFAGSSSVHERRRRRLAQESDVGIPQNVEATSSLSVRKLPGVASDLTPLHMVIRPQIWIHWCIAALCLLCWGGMLYVGDLAEQHDFGLKSILGLRSGRLAGFFSTIMLLWAGQLALLIYWYRRKSRNDFHGRYRLWLWIGATLQFFLAVVATEAHVPFSAYMQRMWPLSVPNYALLSWLAPVSTISLAIYQLLRLETEESRCSRVLLRLTGVAGVAAASALITGPLLPDRTACLLQVGFSTLAQLGLALTLLFHSRFVIHISNEAPLICTREAKLKSIQKDTRDVIRAYFAGLSWPRIKFGRRRHANGASGESAETPSTSGRAHPAGRKSNAIKSSSTARTETQAEVVTPAASVSGVTCRVDASEGLKGPKGPVLPANQLDQSATTSVTGDSHLIDRKERQRLRKRGHAAK